MSDDPAHMRDKGLEFLRKGKDYFNKHQEREYREKGYELYKRGLECIIKYLKSNPFSLKDLLSNIFLAETNSSIAAKVRENLKVWMEDAKTMEATLYQNQQKAAPSQNNYQPQNNNYQQPNAPNYGYNAPSNNNYAPNNYQPTPSQPSNNQAPKKDSPRYFLKILER